MFGWRKTVGMNGSAGAAVRPDDGRWRVGIRGKLFGAFAGVASLTLVASVVALFSYGYIDRSLHRIEADGIPAVDRAFTLARQAAELSAISSSVVAANDQAERGCHVNEKYCSLLVKQKIWRQRNQDLG